MTRTEASVISLLASFYPGPFVLVRPGRTDLMVLRG